MDVRIWMFQRSQIISNISWSSALPERWFKDLVGHSLRPKGCQMIFLVALRAVIWLRVQPWTSIRGCSRQPMYEPSHQSWMRSLSNSTSLNVCCFSTFVWLIVRYNPGVLIQIKLLTDRQVWRSHESLWSIALPRRWFEDLLGHSTILEGPGLPKDFTPAIQDS